MDAESYNRQIKQMVGFILQEAKEKANEIYIKTEHDFSLEKQLKVHSAKLKIQGEYKQKLKEAETQRRIRRSVAVGEVNIRKYQKRDELVQRVKAEAVKRLTAAAGADAGKYTELMKRLIIQGLIKLNESKVEVVCREVDARIAQQVLEPAARQYESMIKEATGEAIRVEITLSNKYLAGPSKGDGAMGCSGGVKLSAKGGRIVCDNTLDSRLGIAFDELMPVIRQMLFTA